VAGPIKQFEIVSLFSFGKIGGYEIALTNSAAYMMLTAAIASSFLILSARNRSLVPRRWQAAAELLYEFVAKTLRENAGEHGMRFFPLVFSLFMFVLIANLVGMIPYSFTVTSHLFVTFTLAMMVFLTVTIYGFWKHGLGFLRLFLPDGVPIALAPVLVPIEIISYLARPISHSVRLFAVMLAGHITLKVCGICRKPLELRGCGRSSRHPSPDNDIRDHRARIPDGDHSGLHLHHADLHVHKRCHPSLALSDRLVWVRLNSHMWGVERTASSHVKAHIQDVLAPFEEA
jgi:F-type H+-transporting ATPase subunit a